MDESTKKLVPYYNFDDSESFDDGDSSDLSESMYKRSRYLYDNEYDTANKAGDGWNRLKYSRNASENNTIKKWMPNIDYMATQAKKMLESNDSGNKKVEYTYAELHQLNQLRKSISNFCSILLDGKTVSVYYYGTTSKTDGNSIFISSEVVSNFDVVCGLALHEASHIKWTDFDMLRVYMDDIKKYTKKRFSDIVKKIIKDNVKKLSDNVVEQYTSLMTDEFVDFYHYVSNWCEDRRIDNLAIKNYPGYIGYYSALYDKHLRNDVAKEVIEKNERYDDIVKDYQMYITLSLVQNFNKNALRSLAKITKLIDPNILSNLQQRDVYDVAKKVFNIVLDEYEEYLESLLQDNEIPDMPMDSDSSEEGNSGNTPSNKNSGNNKESNDGAPENDSNNEEKSPSKDTDKDSSDTGNSDLNKLENHINDVVKNNKNKSNSNADPNSPPRTFVLSDEEGDGTSGEPVNFRPGIDKLVDKDGNEIDVNKLAGKRKEEIDKMLEEIKGTVVNNDYTENRENTKDNKTIKKALSKEMADVLDSWVKSGSIIHNSCDFNCAFLPLIRLKDFYNTTHPIHNVMRLDKNPGNTTDSTELQNAYNYGKSLRPKLKFFNMESTVKIPRRLEGKLDRKKLYGFYANENRLFYTENIAKGEEFHFHFALDASGSMRGKKWLSARCVLMTIVSALHNIPGISISVDMRTNIRNYSQYSTDNSMPMVGIIYDSRHSTPRELLEMFRMMTSTGNDNADGISIDATRPFLETITKKKNKIFINISDGEPSHHSQGKTYHGDEAVEHTTSAVNRVRKLGYQILGFFIESVSKVNFENTSEYRQFCKQYGNNSKFVGYSDTIEIARAINDIIAKSSGSNGIKNVF